MGYSIAYNSGTTTPFGTFKQGPITMGLKPDEYTVSSGFTWYANAEYLNDAYLIISDTYSQGWSTQVEAKPTIWRSATGTTESFVSLVNQLPDVNGVTGFTDSGTAMGYLQSTGKYFVSKDEYLGIVTDGLILNLDAGWYLSYSGSGTTWKDLTGSNNGTLTNGPTFSGGSIVFDGTNDYGTLPTNLFGVANYTNISTLTIDVWVNWNNFPTNDIDEFISWWAGGSSTVGFLGTTCTSNGGGTNTNPSIRFGDGWQNTGVKFTASTDTNKWWNITAVKSSNNAYIYKNGNLETTRGSSMNFTVDKAPAIGCHDGSRRIEFFDGKIAVIRVYNRDLSSTEILQNFNAQKGRFGL